MKRIIFVFLLVIVVAGGGMFYSRLQGARDDDNLYRTAVVSRGNLLITVGATGTVEPEEQVDIGAQVIGRIKKLGDDPRGKSDEKFANKRIDYGSPVEEGMLLAQIDPAIYQAQFDQAQASLVQAKANVLQMEAKLAQADAEWKRAQRLSDLKITSRSPTGSGYSGQSLAVKGISDADFILAQANFDSAKANIEAAKAAVLQQQAALEMARTNLGFTTIISPVSGTIIDRRVNIGQTVVSNLNAPSLFLIARDLRRMQVWASVNEADIGRLKIGTPVHFRVDAFPEDVFQGIVAQIRLNASMTQNVVIYTVVISVDNSDLKLLPYLTADVKFEVDSRSDVLLVPNAALRFTPKPENLIPNGAPSEEDQTASSPAKSKASPSSLPQRVWTIVAATGKLQAVNVKAGLSDGSFTEILSGDLSVNDAVVVGERREIATGGETNPFGPPKLGGNRPKK